MLALQGCPGDYRTRLVRQPRSHYDWVLPGAFMSDPDFADIAAHITAESIRDLLIDLVDSERDR